jgi:hypothetical protein
MKCLKSLSTHMSKGVGKSRLSGGKSESMSDDTVIRFELQRPSEPCLFCTTGKIYGLGTYALCADHLEDLMLEARESERMDKACEQLEAEEHQREEAFADLR